MYITTEFQKQKLTELQGWIDKFIIIVGDSNTPSVIDTSSSREWVIIIQFKKHH